VRRASSLLALAIATTGCDPSIGSAPPDVPATAATSPPASPAVRRQAEQRAEQGSRYRVGDFVVYRYTGSFSEQPVVLRERVIDKQGQRLTIEVTAERGQQRRGWIQVVSDTAENREKNRIDELYELTAGKRQRLPNADNADLLRLYAWTLPPCTGPEQAAGKVDMELPVTGVRFKCTCKRSQRTCAGKPAQIEICECPDFVWMHASGEVHALDDPELIWKAEVERFGNTHD
jgi:hypothetical protein